MYCQYAKTWGISHAWRSTWHTEDGQFVKPVVIKGIVALVMGWTQEPLRLFFTSKSLSLITRQAQTLLRFLFLFTSSGIMTRLTFLSFGKHSVPLLINKEPGRKQEPNRFVTFALLWLPTTDSRFLQGREKDCSIACQFQEKARGAGGMFAWHSP